ncbi:MAG: M10 family metallopeptidase C-terminal domain-containing protein [Gemmobacter sp.]|uniref:calcium-binding protein n=1 Tax=Gemmobacter sp. TaxID=1898957 RepID=UPI001A3A7A79|nr:calcium-binding protein [Gemmobacter sp.]MBL8562651.1 M10 family metallopeptidase C-terminal domain-containing protein [Gemmobacter sp.]
MPGPSLGTNLHGLVDWTTAFPFVNLFRQSRPWYTQSEGAFDTGQAELLDLDAAGWVRGFTQDGSTAPFERVSTILFTGGHVPAGTYVLDWQGAGEIELGFIGADQILSQEEGRITFRLEAGQMLQISILSTDPAGSGDYLRDIRLYNEQDSELIEAGAIFTPEFIEKIDDFRALRFMDWMATNNSTIVDWEDRRPLDAARDTVMGEDDRGASVEVMVALANATRADPWFTLPHMASDDYIRQFVTYVRDHLDPGLVARFELSNEVWNWGFDQAHFAQAEAARLWGAEAEGGWMQWYGMRAAQMAGIVAEVFGEETGTRALNVFATQAGWQGLEQYALDAPDYVAAGGTPPRDAPFHIYAIAPYFGGSLASEAMEAQVADWIAAGEAGFTAAIAWLRTGDGFDTLANLGAIIAYHAQMAEDLGWQLEAYEGGQHIVDLDGLFGGAQDPAQTAFFTELVRHPGFEALYAEYFALWRENGGGLLAHFSDFGEGGRYGSWGIWDSAYAEDSARARAVEAFRDGTEAWWADDRDPGTFLNGATLVDRAGQDRLHGTALADLLSGLDGNNRLFGAAGDDRLMARDGQDSLSGGRGKDALSGGGGDDRLQGGTGRDVLNGDAGDDVLLGGWGSDLLTGGAGADRFVFTPGQGGRDIITDFQRGEDRIDLSGLGLEQSAWHGQRGLSRDGEAELVLRVFANGTLALRIDLQGDGRADVVIRLAGLDQIDLGDLIL